MLLLQLLCCYCYSDIEFCYNCYYERVIASMRRGQTATIPLLLLTSFSIIAGANAFADGSVSRVELLTALKLLRSCYCNCTPGIATPTSRFATITIANATADAGVARVGLLRVVIVRMLLLHIQRV